MNSHQIATSLFLLFFLITLSPLPSPTVALKSNKIPSKKDVLKYYMFLKAIKGEKKKIIPIPVPVFVLPFVIKKAKKLLNKEAEFYLVKPKLKPREFVRRYIAMNGGYHSLYY